MLVEEPTTPTLIRVKSRISAANWQARVAQARRDEKKIQALETRVAAADAELKDADAKLIESLSSELQVTDKTPPAFLFRTTTNGRC